MKAVNPEFENALFPIVIVVNGVGNDNKLVQESNALLPILVSVGVVSNVKFFNKVQ